MVQAGGDEVAVLLRDIALPAEALWEWGAVVLPICRAGGAHLLLHGDPEIARALGADGVHLPDQHAVGVARARGILGAGGLIGASRHDEGGVREAQGTGADYVTLSPIFSTPGKGAPLGLEGLAEIARTTAVPIVALGGITAARAGACRAAGAAAVGAIRSVWVGDPGANVRRLLEGP